MLTIHDISVLDEWKGTKSYGLAGGEITRILRKNKIHSDFDVQYFYDSEDNIKEIKFIIEGIPHNSEAERNITFLIYSEINPSYIPELWDDTDFVRIDRELAEKELNESYAKIKYYEDFLKLEPSERPYRNDLIRKHDFFNYLTEIRGVTVGITPKRFYKAPAAVQENDSKGISRMVSHLPEGEYTVYHILNHDGFQLISSEEIWAKSEAELFNAIDARRGKLCDKPHSF